jgi:hypothetical protein
MNGDDSLKASNDPFGGVFTYAYDCLGTPVTTENRTIDNTDGGDVSIVPAEHTTRLSGIGMTEAARPGARHTFEFRLAGSETQEQAWPGGGPRTGSVAIQRVRAYLSRLGAAPADPSAIAGLEVHAERRAAGIVCTAQLSDFGTEEIVVVQVDAEVA